MTSAAPGPTNPEAGVIEASPAIAPVTAPTMLGLPNFVHSMRIHTSAAVAAETWVTVKAMPALPPADSALPALKPNPPTQSMQAPAIVIHGACGGLISSGKPALGPSTTASTSAETPAVRCTTRPPAKSSAPLCPSQPPPQTQ